jgi:hypothetical protein
MKPGSSLSFVIMAKVAFAITKDAEQNIVN